MIKKEDVKDLELALHRKLLNIGSDIRKCRKVKSPDTVILEVLKKKRKLVDATLNATKQFYNHFDSYIEPDALYSQYIRLYRDL